MHFGRRDATRHDRARSQSLSSYFEVLAYLLAHLLRRVVRVAPRPVPVSGDGLGVEGHDHAELLAHALEEVSRDPQLVAGGDAYAGTHLLAFYAQKMKGR